MKICNLVSWRDSLLQQGITPNSLYSQHTIFITREVASNYLKKAVSTNIRFKNRELPAHRQALDTLQTVKDVFVALSTSPGAATMAAKSDSAITFESLKEANKRYKVLQR